MNKISSIHINGLKSYVSPTKIKLSDMNVFSGINSVGKSTCIQSILLLRLLYENLNERNSYLSESFLNSEKYAEIGLSMIDGLIKEPFDSKDSERMGIAMMAYAQRLILSRE
mgnify:CR=1 FL=1